MKHKFLSIFRLFFLLSITCLIQSCSSKKQASNKADLVQETYTSSLSLSNLFTDHMVLQRESYVSIFGTAGKHSVIRIQGSWGDNARTIADDTGQWLAKIKTPTAGGPYSLSITEGELTIELNDILIGEVWLASGQSNMQMPVTGWPPKDPIDNSTEEIAQANFPQIRMMTVQRHIAHSPKDDFLGSWAVASPATVGQFSATAYFFARRLNQELQIPIGIIHTSWGGTVAEAWTSKDKLYTLGDFDNTLNSLVEESSESEIEAWLSDKSSVEIPTTNEGFAALNFNDENASTSTFLAAKEITLPGRFDMIDAKNIDGAFWMYKEFMVEEKGEYTLDLGAIDDIDATYINGQLVGGINGYNVDRTYNIPKDLLRRGRNRIAIRAIDTGGPGSINGPMQLSSENGGSISLDGSWSSAPVAEIYDGKFYIYDLDKDISSSRPNIFGLNQNTPTVLYNAMIHPLIPYKIKGAIWYQGESNVARAQQYRRLFPSMINDWRERWGYSFPFYFVQIAPYKYGGAAENQSQKLRDAQRRTLNLENTGMVVTMDIGNFTNIHPANKQDVGKRLAGLALSNQYGKNNIASGPNYTSKTIDGNSIILEFDSVGSGLLAADGGLTDFEIAGRNGRFKTAVAKIVGNTVIVSSENVDAPVHVRYAWNDKGNASLFNTEGFPASSFTTK